VSQTVLPALVRAKLRDHAPSGITLGGGTHNAMAARYTGIRLTARAHTNIGGVQAFLPMRFSSQQPGPGGVEISL
jgi:hypothetical protein